MRPQGGRAPYYFIFNEKKELEEIVKNPFAIGGGGAGISVAKMLADKGVEFFGAGFIGGNMAEALEDRGIKYQEINGKIREGLDRVIQEN